MGDEEVLPIELVAMERLRKRVLDLAIERNLTQRDMEKAARVAHSTYDGMWTRGTVTLIRLERIAQRLGIDVVQLLRGEGDALLAPKPKYVEERLEQVEREVRNLRNELKKR